MKKISGKKYTARELAQQFGCNDETIRTHAVKLFGHGEHGKTRYFDELQVTAILESIKGAVSKGRHIADDATSRNISGSETALSDEYRLAMLYKQQAEILKEANTLEQKLRLKTETRLRETERKLGEEVVSHGRTRSGLEMYQRIAESAGLSMTDREDMLRLYRREKQP